jgi:hypothetical protein
LNAYGSPLTLHGVNSNCYKCRKPQLGAVVSPGDASETFVLPAAHAYALDVYAGTTRIISEDLRLDEHGVYSLVVHSGTPVAFTRLTDVEGNATWVWLVAAFFIMVGIAGLYTVGAAWAAKRYGAAAGSGGGGADAGKQVRVGVLPAQRQLGVRFFACVRFWVRCSDGWNGGGGRAPLHSVGVL